ncbi:MAG: hypothetical protein ACI8PZ_004017 [Myxococcota bacterium]|jgi:hypothetical protein
MHTFDALVGQLRDLGVPHAALLTGLLVGGVVRDA